MNIIFWRSRSYAVPNALGRTPRLSESITYRRTIAGIGGALGATVVMMAAAMGTGSAMAQASANNSGSLLTLQQAVQASWARQPEQRAAPARRDAASASVQSAQRWTLEPPALELGLKTDRLSRNEGGREQVAGVSVPLWLPGERQQSLLLAEAELHSLNGRMAAALWRTAGAVREAWWAFHLAVIEVDLAQDRQLAAQRLTDDVARRVKAGDLAPADEHQAQAVLAAAQAQSATSVAMQSRARQALKVLLGSTPSSAWSSQAEALPNISNSDAVIDRHPLLQEWAAQAALARSAQDLARVQKRANPELTLQAVRERGAYGERYGQSVNVGLRFPLGSNPRYQAKVALAMAEQIEADTQLANERERLLAEATAAEARVQGARLASEAAARRAALAQQTRGYFAKSFNLGETDWPTRLRVESEAFEAERAAARARIEWAEAVSAWRQTLGLLPE
jgi:outer membrane protein, heavy metal efflux system